MKGSLVKIETVLAAVALAASSVTAGAQAGGAPSSTAAAQSAAAPAALTDGEVRKVDKENKKITLKHGEIKNLEMPGMTMVFQVKDAAMLDAVKPGDKVRFMAEKAGTALVVTAIEVVK
jgi:Cu(I)/Ag(I) efflux system protein CusF